MEDLNRSFKRLEASEMGFCAHYLNHIKEIEKVSIYTALEQERLERKVSELMDLYLTDAHQCWPEALFVYLMKYINDKSNQAAFMELARRTEFMHIMQENRSVETLEAFLIGTSGLLEIYPEDNYTTKLRREFEHIARKYKITPMKASDWNISNTRPANHPVLRMASLAAMLHGRQRFFDQVIECETLNDVVSLLSFDASSYWNTHYTPGVVSPVERVKTIGAAKCNILGINVVATMMFAYGRATQNDECLQRTERLLENLKPESHVYTNPWMNHGLKIKSAYDSQALTQLASVYCKDKRCRECPVGVRAAKNLSWMPEYK